MKQTKIWSGQNLLANICSKKTPAQCIHLDLFCGNFSGKLKTTCHFNFYVTFMLWKLYI